MSWSRWKYRHMAWKNDPYLWVEMHPRLTRLFERAYEGATPVLEWAASLYDSAATKRKIQAIQDVYGDQGGEVKYWKYSGNAADIYADARARGWKG